MKPAAASVAIGLVALASSAHANTSVVGVDDARQTCRYHAADVARWTPKDGPAARFIVESDADFIALGRTDEGFWSAQTTRGDACDTCVRTALVFTRFDTGRSRRYPLTTKHDDDGDRAGRKAAMLTRLWHLAQTDWPVRELRHDYAVVTPPQDATSGNADVIEGSPRYRGWLVGIVQGGRWRLRYTTEITPFMCWCDTSWRSYGR